MKSFYISLFFISLSLFHLFSPRPVVLLRDGCDDNPSTSVSAVVLLSPDQIPLFVECPIPVDELSEVQLIPRAEPALAVHHVVPYEPLERVGVLVRFDEPLLLRLDPFEHVLRHADRVERQLLGQESEPRLDLIPEDVAANLQDDAAGLHRGRVVTDGTLAAAELLALAVIGDGMVRRIHSVQGKTPVLLCGKRTEKWRHILRNKDRHKAT